MKINKSNLISAALLVASLFVGSAYASGYWVDGQGSYIRSASGDCVKSGSWTHTSQVVGCDTITASRPKPARIVLLPDPGGTVGAVIVRDHNVELLLSKPYEGLQAGAGAGMVLRPESAQSVRSRYGDVLDAVSPRPLTFLVRFDVGSATKLTDDSVLILTDVDLALRSWPSPQLMIVGHTDRVGTLESNDELSLKRAQTVVRYLRDRGIPADRIEAAGRGERELLFPTSDGIADSRNRRVEITIR